MKGKEGKVSKPEKESKNGITLDDLGAMVARGFTEVDKRFDEVYKRFDEVDKRFEEVDARFTVVESKIDVLHSEVLSMNFDHKKFKHRLENVEVRVFGSIQEP